ncbi:hypothetical protein ABRP84_10195 [Corynebacterium sp. KPL2861]|uniref:hypothetical protein n=1 Tax=unclassified Corynebacterium TaxID=2624378 RepID=UPI0032ECE5EB
MFTLKKVPESAILAVKPPWATAKPVTPKAASPAASAVANFGMLILPMKEPFCGIEKAG